MPATVERCNANELVKQVYIHYHGLSMNVSYVYSTANGNLYACTFWSFIIHVPVLQQGIPHTLKLWCHPEKSGASSGYVPKCKTLTVQCEIAPIQ